jgi:PAS domain S-box-containing protein
MLTLNTPLQRYAFAAVLAVVAGVATWLLLPLVGVPTFILLSAAIILTANYAGFLPALAAIALSSIAHYLMTRGSAITPADETVRLLLFIAVSAFTAILIDRHRQTGLEARRSKRHYDAVVEQAVDGIAIINEDGLFIEANRSAAAIFGYTPEELIGLNIAHLIPPEQIQLQPLRIREIIESGNVGFERTVVRKDGSTIIIEGNSTLLDDGTILIIGRDVTERRRTHEELRRRAEEFNLLYETGRQLGSTLNTDEIYDTTRHLLSDIIECHSFVVSLYEPDEQLIRCVFAYIEGSYIDVTELPPVPLAPEGRGLQSQVIRTGEPKLINNFQEQLKQSVTHYRINQDGSTQQEADEEAYQTESSMLTPIMLEGRVLGVLQVNSHNRNAYTEEQLNLLGAIVSQMAAATRNSYLYQQAQEEIAERARIEEELRLSQERQHFLVEASRVLAGSLDYSSTLKNVADLAVPRLADWCVIDMVGEDGELLRLAIANPDRSWIEMSVEEAKRTAGMSQERIGNRNVIRTGLSELYSDVSDDLLRQFAHDEEHLEALRLFNPCSILVVPLKAGDRTIGAITMATSQSKRRLGTVDLELAEGLALRASTSIENSRLFSEAERANKAKDHFMATLSHELRTPLTPALGVVQILQEEEDIPERLRPLLDIIHRNINLEARLIDDLLDLTRIAVGKLRLENDVIDMHRLLANVIEICQPDLAQKNIVITSDLRAEIHVVRGDSARLQQVFWNLVKNAIKFTPDGEYVVVRSRDSAEGIVIEVVDTGIGIEANLLSEIFESFVQAEQSQGREFGGLGLGLAISKTLVELHRGTITATSGGKGHGATFSVTLPVVEPVAPPAGNGAGHPADTTTHIGGRILVVDDHNDTVRIMRLLLERRGYEVLTASSLQSALEVASTSGFDLVISDIGLPDGSGFELIEQLSTQGPVKAIAISGFGSDDDVRRSLDAGFCEHLTKPVSLRDLHGAIDRMMG